MGAILGRPFPAAVLTMTLPSPEEIRLQLRSWPEVEAYLERCRGGSSQPAAAGSGNEHAAAGSGEVGASKRAKPAPPKAKMLAMLEGSDEEDSDSGSESE